MTLLFNHDSPETAYLVEDYPYGFRLRCKIRYWLEFSKNKGVRFCSQTTNPKKMGEVWNKPKYSTYCRFGGAMYMDEQNHVQWSGLHEYMDLTKSLEWMAKFETAIPEAFKPIISDWMRKKIIHDKQKSEGKWFMSINGVHGEPLKPELDWSAEETKALIHKYI